MTTVENNTANRFITELANVPADRLEADLIDLAGRLSAGTFELLVLVGELDALVTRSGAPAGAPLTQQRADALAAIATGGGGNVDAEMVIHVRGDVGSGPASNTTTVQPYAQGGPTVVATLRRLCGPHNRARTQA